MLPTLLSFVAAPVVIAQGETLLLGEDFLPWMVLAFGAAMVVGNVAALLRPPQGDPDDSDSTAGARADWPRSRVDRDRRHRGGLGLASLLV